MAPPPDAADNNNDHLVQSEDPDHPANLIASLCAKFWPLGWVTGTGGGCSIRKDDLVYIAPSGVQKELMRASDMYVLSLSAQPAGALADPAQRIYLRRSPRNKPSSCTPLFLASFTLRGARCCIHTHSQWAVLVTLLLEAEAGGNGSEFRINNFEQIKAFGRGHGRTGNLENFDTLVVPVVENTPHEEQLTGPMTAVMERYPDTYAVLVRRHGVYVWGDTLEKAKAMCESLDYLFQLAVEMKKLGLPWISDLEQSRTNALKPA